MKYSLIFLFVLGLISCTNVGGESVVLSLEDECNQTIKQSKQCEIINLKELSLDEKENLMGWLYLNGAGDVQPDFSKAYYWFEKASKSNNDEAVNSLGYMNFFGLGRGVDLKASEKFFLKAIQLGNIDAKFNIAELYRVSKPGKHPDYIKAEKYYMLGIKDNPSKAYEGLSKMYYEQGKLKDAYEYSLKGAELNNSEAIYNLGVMSEQGIFVEKDLEKAKYWYQKAAKQGHKDAKHNLEGLK